MKTLHPAKLQQAAPMRKRGYLEAIEKVGRKSPCGQFILVTEEDYAALRQEFNPLPPPPKSYNVPFVPSPRGLGDIIHAVAGPIGRAINWPCLKGDGTTDLKPGSPCSRARTLLNKVKV